MSNQRKPSTTSGSGKGAPATKKRDFEEVSPTTPEGQVTMANIRNMFVEHLDPIQSDLDNMKKSIKSDIDGLKTSIQSVTNKLSEITTLRNSVGILESNYAKVCQKLENSEIKSRDLEEKLLRVETFSRKNNLKFLNVKFDPTAETREDCELAIVNICKQHGIDLGSKSIERAHRIGNRKSTQRPIIVKFNNYKDKLMVLRKKGTFKNSGITIVEDFPTEIQSRHKLFSPILNAAYASGGKHKARLLGDRLLLNGKTYSVNDLNTLPSDLQPSDLCTKTVGNVTAFFTGHSPFSNLFKCSFSVKDVTYASVEHYFVYNKAKFFGDQAIAKTIMATENPKDVKLLGKKVSNFSWGKWNEVRDHYMEEGLKAKFEQNASLRLQLQETGDRILAEANANDSYWGIGLPLESNDIWDTANWKGQNKLGNLLCKLRETI